jgi:hypothetical protein
MNRVSTRRRARPAESRPAIPAGRSRKIMQLRQTRCFQVSPTKLSMQGPVQRCARLSACEGSPNEIGIFNYPCPSSCLRGCDEGSMPQPGSVKYVYRTREPNTATAMRFSLDRADAIHVFFSKFHSYAKTDVAGEPVAPPSTKISAASW